MSGEKIEARWEGIAAVAAVIGLSGVATTAVLSGYDCQYVTLIVVGIAGLGGFTYRQYLRANGDHS